MGTSTVEDVNSKTTNAYQYVKQCTEAALVRCIPGCIMPCQCGRRKKWINRNNFLQNSCYGPKRMPQCWRQIRNCSRRLEAPSMRFCFGFVSSSIKGHVWVHIRLLLRGAPGGCCCCCCCCCCCRCSAMMLFV